MLQQETQNLTGLQYILAKQQELKKAEAEAGAVGATGVAGGQPIIESGNLDDWENGDGDAGGSGARHVTPFERMQHCRDALEYLDSWGWNRTQITQDYNHIDDILATLENLRKNLTRENKK